MAREFKRPNYTGTVISLQVNPVPIHGAHGAKGHSQEVGR